MQPSCFLMCSYPFLTFLLALPFLFHQFNRALKFSRLFVRSQRLALEENTFASSMIQGLESCSPQTTEKHGQLPLSKGS